jgi:Holliday junction resolvase RusA-like endonuclease
MMFVVIFANVAIAFAPTSCRIIRKSTQTSQNHLVSSGTGRFRSSYVVQYAINSTIQDAPDQKLASKHRKSPTPTKTTKEKCKPKPTAEPTRKSNVDKKGEWYYWSNESDMAVIESNHPQTNQLDPSSSPSPGQKQQVSRLRFTVRGNPRPLQRHRTSRGFMYNPSLKYQTSFQHVVKNLLVGNESDSNDRPSSLTYPIFGPDEYLVMNIVFKMKRPKSHFVNNKPGHGRLKVSSTGMMSSTIRTDIDNLVKFVLDSMNEVLYEDDRQIVSIQATKVFDNDDTCEGSIDVNIRRIETDDDMDEIIRSSFK